MRELGPPEDYAAVPRRPDEYWEIHEIEDSWNAYEVGRIPLSALPPDGASFEDWYERLHALHRQKIADFFDHIATTATLEELAFYVCLEEQVDGRFDDVVALAQLGMSGDQKLVLAENYWDEMGHGRLGEMHTIMFAQSARHMSGILQGIGIDVAGAVPAEALKNGNLLLMYALRRRYALRLLGALSILEDTAPYRFAKTVEGLRRVGMPEEVIRYHALHIEVDAEHGRQLFDRVLRPLVIRSALVRQEIAIGCLIRYQVAVDYYRSIEDATRALGLDRRHRAGDRRQRSAAHAENGAS